MAPVSPARTEDPESSPASVKVDTARYPSTLDKASRHLGLGRTGGTDDQEPKRIAGHAIGDDRGQGDEHDARVGQVQTPLEKIDHPGEGLGLIAVIRHISPLHLRHMPPRSAAPSMITPHSRHAGRSAGGFVGATSDFRDFRRRR